MLTRTLFSTISYNTDAWLIEKLNELVEDRTLIFWCFINHKAEEDETKDHKHVLFMPNGQLETSTIARFLEEFDPSMPDKPLKCGVFKHSQFSDWYLYALHDSDYLASKGQERRYHYSADDIVSYDADFLYDLVHTSDFSKWKKEAEFRRAVKSRKSFSTLLDNGFIPIQQIYQYHRAYDILTEKYFPPKNNEKIYREHVDTQTGESTYIELDKVLPFFGSDEGV